MHSVLLATCAAHPEGDEDAALLGDALAEDNLAARWAVWTDPHVDWRRGPVVIRATWDYPLQRDRFLDWVGSLPAVFNPAPVVAWNSDKVYLHDLEEAGVPITPTVVVPPGVQPTFPADGEFVVKPSVGAGSRGVGRFDRAGDLARAHIAALHEAGRTVLIQPYLDEIDTAGETALIYLAGTFSHAVTKAAMLVQAQAYPLMSDAGLYVQETITAVEPSAAERAVGERAMAALRARFGDVLLYARVDLVPGNAGPMVLEVELVEPSLYLAHGECAAQRFAAAIARHI